MVGRNGYTLWPMKDTPQHRWRLKQIELGRCQQCRDDAAPGHVLCSKHMEAARMAGRRWRLRRAAARERYRRQAEAVL